MDLFLLVCVVVATFSTNSHVESATLNQLVPSEEKNVHLELRSEGKKDSTKLKEKILKKGKFF